MIKTDLPETLFIPSLQLSQGCIDFQLRDDHGNIAIPAWRDGSSATSWLETGGLQLAKSNDSGLRHNLTTPNSKVVVRIIPRDEYFTLNSFLASTPNMPKRVLHFEPDHGILFAPPDRCIPLA